MFRLSFYVHHYQLSLLGEFFYDLLILTSVFIENDCTDSFEEKFCNLYRSEEFDNKPSSIINAFLSNDEQQILSVYTLDRL